MNGRHRAADDGSSGAHSMAAFAVGLWGRHLEGLVLAPAAFVAARRAQRRASDRGAILDRRDRRLRALIRRAAVHVPYYRYVFQGVGLEPGDIETATDLAKIPLLDRQVPRTSPEAMIAENARLWFCELWQTSGTTGTPLRILVPLASRLSNFVKMQRRLDQLGLRSSDFAPFGGNYLYISDTEYRTQFRDWSSRLPVFRLSQFVKLDIRQEFAGDPVRLLTRVHRLQPVILTGKPSSLLAFAGLAERHGTGSGLRISPRVVVTGAEQLLQDARERLADAFDCPVFDTYGITEVGLVACECTVRDGLHVEDDETIVEVVRNGRPVPPGQLGEIVVTSLSNRVMPFIRYRTGDVGRLSLMPCACGLAHSRIVDIQGRIVDQFTAPDGTSVNPFGLVGDLPNLGLEQYQLVQRSRDLVLVRYIGDLAPERVCAAVTDAVRTAMGAEVEIRAERVGELRVPGSKMRPYVNEMRARGEAGGATPIDAS